MRKYEDRPQRGSGSMSEGGGAAHGAPGKTTLTGLIQCQAGVIPAPGARSERVHELAADGVRGGGGPLPHAEQIRPAFGRHGHVVDSIDAFIGGPAAAASEAIGAEAFATGNKIAFANAPTLATAAHEAAHVVQQRAGIHLCGGVGEVGDAYERNADAVAARVVRGESAEDLLGVAIGPGSGSGAPIQMIEYDEAKVGAFYRIEGYAFPLYLRAKRRSPAVGTFRMTDKVGPEVTLPLKAVIEQVDAPSEEVGPDQQAERVVLGAIWDAFNRIARVIAVLAPVIEGGEDLSLKVRKALKREGKEFLVVFHANLVKVHKALGPQLATSNLLFTEAAPEDHGSMHETARTNVETGTIKFYAAFFGSDRMSRGNTVSHEMIHKVMKVEDQAYRTTRLFEYLKPEYRLQNPDSYVQLLNELDPDWGGDVKSPPGFEVAEGVGEVPASQLRRDVAVVQHVTQRASYFLATCVGELKDGYIPVFKQQSAHLRGYLKIIGDNETWRGQKEDAKTLRDWADYARLACGLVAAMLAKDVEVVATTKVKEEGQIVDEQNRLRVTYHSETTDPQTWLFVKLLQAASKEPKQFSWKLAVALVKHLESFDVKIVDFE